MKHILLILALLGTDLGKVQAQPAKYYFPGLNVSTDSITALNGVQMVKAFTANQLVQGPPSYLTIEMVGPATVLCYVDDSIPTVVVRRVNGTVFINGIKKD